MTRTIFPAAASASVLLLVLTACSGLPDGVGAVLQETESVELGKTESTRVAIRMPAGELRVQGGSAKLVEANFSYGSPDAKPRVEYRATGSRGQLNIEHPSGMRPGFNSSYNWDLRF
ncbi:MAG: hypothetical protein EXQ47_11255 [Bryobacterales bacterium]|nr:hypothetical protein [Bryobacterales bacterium]